MEKLVSKPSAEGLGKKTFQNFLIGVIDLWILYKSTKDNKLWQFNFKVVHRIITTKKELLKYKLASDDKCSFCLNPDSTEHTFFLLSRVKGIFSKTLRWFNEYHFQTTKFYLTRLVTPFQCKCQFQLNANFVYWFHCKNIVMKPNLEEFLRKLFEQYRIENCGKQY